ncbi:hypothetical protein [Phenylobacterium sp.]|uniref:hypothetical protein n=1 Tax=Phenylobacterium sp. TaxID=1871053 RepID=UPI00286D7473|nr:hypothetical protein [Phenylobacterium sp.]
MAKLSDSEGTMNLKRLPIFVRWAVFAVTVYVITTVVQAVILAYPDHQADVRFNLEFLFWIWAIPTPFHYLAIGIGRAVNLHQMSRPLSGPGTDELAWKAFTRPDRRRSPTSPQDPDVS